VFVRKRRGRFFQRLRSEIVCRRVDEIAPERHRRRDALELRAVDALRGDQPGTFVLRVFVFAEAVAREQEGERRQRAVMRFIAEAVHAFGQAPRKLPRQERIGRACVRLVERKQHARNRAIIARDQQHSPRLRLKPACPSKSARAVGQGGFVRLPRLSRDEMDRNGVGCGFYEGEWHRLPKVLTMN
jgi:hypothetical protein